MARKVYALEQAQTGRGLLSQG